MLSKKIRLCNIRVEKELIRNEETDEFEELPVTFATVFVNKEKKQYFFNKIKEYARKESETGKPYLFNPPSFLNEFRGLKKIWRKHSSKIYPFTRSILPTVVGVRLKIPGKPKNANLINSIADIRKALFIESFWHDDHSLIPDEKPQWCEVWLRDDNPDVIFPERAVKDDKPDVIKRLEKLIDDLNIVSKLNYIIFPERAVKLVFVNNEQLADLTRLSDDIAGFRKAKDTTTFWTEMPNREQAKWAEDIIERLQVNRESLVSVCILDTGVNNGHPLISPILDSADCQSFDPLWGSHDHYGHGTLMAGISGYGNLAEHLSGQGPIFINHMLESVKILPPEGRGKNKPELWGYITSQGVSLAEIQAPDRKRICCMAVTASDNRDRGKPSSWSGALDQITSGVDDGTKRLMVVSAGNITDFNQLSNYPDNQITDSVHDPAQSWNALTVGAYTQLTTITDPTLKGYLPIAQVNQLSPFSTTSLTWDNKWPIKPEIVMEGGNAAVKEHEFSSECDDLSLLSTNYQPQARLFESFNMTSAAAAQGAHFAAQIQIRYPDYWPETIRALVVHSAEWTDALKSQFAKGDSKTQLRDVLRACGYGVPNLERALYSAMNSLTLISQAEIQPYEKNRTRDMHLYDLPWPIEILRELQDAEVEMRVTLSYFIEPGPGEIGWKDRYRYPSYALRFKINSPTEKREQFIKRINAEARDEDEGHLKTKSASDRWVIGSKGRDKGSIHSDIWKGIAADLAESHYIAVVPIVGWWRERAYLGKCESKARYSLIVTIRTPEQKVDIYTPVAQEVGVIVPVAIS
ncbi:MAG: S8 family peptidase [Candidatus Eremiobacteraeota bacterium]|nr:S8 family peptidase [Candidatus Eremiobacteraeota bacterium]